jgi:hypothetical protein
MCGSSPFGISREEIMNKKAAVLAGAITAAGIFGVAAPAQAADRTCASGYFCVWAGAPFSTAYPMFRINVEYDRNGNWARLGLGAISKADSSWRNLHSSSWLVCDYGTVNDTKTIVLSYGQEIRSSSAANDRGEGNELVTNNWC